MRKPWPVPVLGVLLAAVATTNLSCAVAAWVAAQFGPQEKVAALYAPPEGKKILVFVDDILNPVSYEPIKIELSRRLNQIFVEENVADEAVSYDRLADLIRATPQFNRLAVSEVGRKLGADIVLYVHIDAFSLRDPASDEFWRGRLEATVRMTDVQTGRLWPRDREAGYRMDEVETESTPRTSDTTADELTQVLAAMMADRIAKLFYDHERPYQGAWGSD